jgi:hypothetical protein
LAKPTDEIAQLLQRRDAKFKLPLEVYLAIAVTAKRFAGRPNIRPFGTRAAAMSTDSCAVLAARTSSVERTPAFEVVRRMLFGETSMVESMPSVTGAVIVPEAQPPADSVLSDITEPVVTTAPLVVASNVEIADGCPSPQTAADVDMDRQTGRLSADDEWRRDIWRSYGHAKCGLRHRWGCSGCHR